MPQIVLLVINVLFHYVIHPKYIHGFPIAAEIGQPGMLARYERSRSLPEMINGEKPVDRRSTDFHKTLKIRIAEFAGIRYDDTG